MAGVGGGRGDAVGVRQLVVMVLEVAVVVEVVLEVVLKVVLEVVVEVGLEVVVEAILVMWTNLGLVATWPELGPSATPRARGRPCPSPCDGRAPWGAA